MIIRKAKKEDFEGYFKLAIKLYEKYNFKPQEYKMVSKI